MKLATWNCTAAGIAILLIAGTLRAQSPRSQPQPTRAGSGLNWRQAGPSEPATNNNYWSEYDTGAQSEDAGVVNDGPIFTQADEYIDDPNCDEGPAYPFTSGYWWRNGCWYAAADFVVWHRTRPFEEVLGFDASLVGVNFDEDLNKRGNSLGVEPGARVTLGYMICRDLDNRDHSIELGYLGFGPWNARDGLISESPRQLFVPRAPNAAGFNAADSYDTFYESQFHSFEVDYRIRNRPGRDRMIMGPDGFWSRQLTPGRTQSLLLGFRGLSIDEKWNWLSRRNGIPFEVFGGDYRVKSDNNLFGMQVGGDCLDIHEGWYWGVRGTAGVYCNFSKGNARIIGNDTQETPIDVDNTARGQASAFFGELSFLTGICLTDHITLRASADMALAGGLVIAPDQVSFDTILADKNPALNEGGQIFYSGFSLGLETYW